MPSKTKRLKASKNNFGGAVEYNKITKDWNDQLDDLKVSIPPESRGRVRTIHEKYLVLMGLRLALTHHLEGIDNLVDAKSLNWTMIEKEVAVTFHIRESNVHDIRQQFFDEGEVEEVETLPRGAAAYDNRKLNNDHLQSIVDEVNRQHKDGESVTIINIQNWIKFTYTILLSMTTIQNYFKILGLSYSAIQFKKRNIGAYRMDLLRDFIKKLSHFYTIWQSDPVNCPFVFVFTDESYIDRKDGVKKSYFWKDVKDFNRTSSKGERLIIMHAISPSGPLVEYDLNN